ncbi:MAG TPA: ADP-ribosylglycohydrolase family protein [Actinomycetota bacterium]|nr:ADP-ribosylglycohydrolase family protein [Actinomycetota bacterium]
MIDASVRGCILGLALGDALGAPFEFRRAHEIPDPIPAFELPWMDRPPGSTTDDTAMARNLARSLAEGGRFDPDDVVRRHLEWFRSDPPDVGSLTRKVLRQVGLGTRAPEAARRVWEERGPEVSAGNGSVMYCAPLGVAYANRPDRLAEIAPRLSALTHYDERCRTAVLAVTVAVAALIRGEGPERAVRTALEAVVDRDGGEELEFLVEAVGATRPVDGPDQGFCLFTAAIGLQTLAREEALEPALRRVVSLGGDTDTNAAVAGALVGAAVGDSALPAGWLARLEDRDELEREASALVPLSRRS